MAATDLGPFLEQGKKTDNGAIAAVPSGARVIVMQAKGGIIHYNVDGDAVTLPGDAFDLADGEKLIYEHIEGLMFDCTTNGATLIYALYG